MHGVRVLYYIKEYCPIKDSSNMTISDWIEIALDIKYHYDNYDGFVVIHGTDTMAYSVSALSFMLENLGKSVVFTGSQVLTFLLMSCTGTYCTQAHTVLFFSSMAGSQKVWKEPNSRI